MIRIVVSFKPFAFIVFGPQQLILQSRCINPSLCHRPIFSCKYGIYIKKNPAARRQNLTRVHVNVRPVHSYKQPIDSICITNWYCFEILYSLEGRESGGHKSTSRFIWNEPMTEHNQYQNKGLNIINWY